jgi:serine/threonine-protein kinase
MPSPPFLEPPYPLIVGRYALFDAIAAGGMASVHVGRLLGSFGFARTVAIKRLHRSMALDPEFLAMFLDEARLAARVHHPNVVQTLDVMALEDELLLVMEYISGAALSKVLQSERKARVLTPERVAVDVMVGVLNGLHAAHVAKNENGDPLDIVHRDVSPQNILIGKDGIARLLDFGIAKAIGAAHTSRPNQIKGKLRYLSPESICGQSVTRASDIYAASVVLWEMLAGRRLFDAEKESDILHQVMSGTVPPPSQTGRHISRTLDEIVMCGLGRDPRARHVTARDMALALEAAVPPVNRSAVTEWVLANAGDEIAERDRRVAQIERAVQGEGAGASLRLQSGRALSAESPFDSRIARRSNEPGSAPSVSLDQSRPLSAPLRGGSRKWLVSVAGGAFAVALLLGALWSHVRSAASAAQAGAAASAGSAASESVSALRPEPAQDLAASPPALPSASAAAAPTPAQVAVGSRATGVRRSPPAASKKLTPDRIYRRD